MVLFLLPHWSSSFYCIPTLKHFGDCRIKQNTNSILLPLLEVSNQEKALKNQCLSFPIQHMHSFTYVCLVIACQILYKEQLYPFQKTIVHSHLLKKSLCIRFYFLLDLHSKSTNLIGFLAIFTLVNRN